MLFLFKIDLMTPDFIRVFHIYKRLKNLDKNEYLSKNEIRKSVSKLHLEYQNKEFSKKILSKTKNISDKTIKRDFNNIEGLYNINIGTKPNKGHFILNINIENIKHRGITDKMEFFLLAQKEKEWSPHISVEESSLNTQIDIIGLISAIEDQVWIKIKFHGWYDDTSFEEIQETKAQPLHIKETLRAWYLIVFVPNLGIKTLCMDERFTYLEITEDKIDIPISFKPTRYFKNSIGIKRDNNKPERIVLKVANHHFKYLVSKPLHPSQKIINYPLKQETKDLNYGDEDIWGTIEITLTPNYEFLMEIFRANIWIKIVSPPSVVNFISSNYKKVIDYYK